MQPYQLWRRGQISYETYLTKLLETNIDDDATDTEPISAGEYELTIANATTIAGATTFTANSTGVLITVPGSITITSAGTLTIN